MELKSCEKCGRKFGALASESLCTKCSAENIESDFKKVRDYLYDNPGADVREVSEETGVSERVILKLLKDERIEIVDESNGLLACERCGVSIKSGRVCDECKNELAKDLMGAAKTLRPEEKMSHKPKEKRKKADFHIKKRLE